MLVSNFIQPLVLLCAVAALTPPLGAHIARVMRGRRTFLDPALSPVERLVYRGLRLRLDREQPWKAYARSLLVFSVASIVGLFALQRAQGLLPLNPDGFGAVAPDLALNTAVSFVTNTNWQNYLGEQTIGNFWVDLTRGVLYVLLPLSVLLAVLLARGVVQNFDGLRPVTTVAGATQTLPGGPVASQEAIKELGTNGGGFHNANSAHPYVAEQAGNPTCFLSILAVLAIAGSLAAKEQVPAGPGTFPTHTPLFVGLLVSVVVIVGALTLFPVLALGPIVEQLLQGTGQLF